MGFYSRKNPKTELLKRAEVIFKSGAILERIRYVSSHYVYSFIFFCLAVAELVLAMVDVSISI